MTIIDTKINGLRYKQQALVKQYDRNFISEELFNIRMNGIKEKISERNNLLLEREKIEKSKTEEIKMSEEVEETKKIGIKVQKNSNASAIAEVLMDKSVKNLDEAVAKFDEKKPGRDAPKTKSQIGAIIREVEKGKGRWVNYTWDKENYLLS